MITANKGIVKMEGIEPMLLAKLSGIVESLVNIGIGKDQIEYAVKLGLMKSEELKEELDKTVQKAVDKLSENIMLETVALHLSNLPEEERKKLEEMLNGRK